MGAKRFRIAFSFAGEKRQFVEKVAALLAHRFGEKAILYDKFHEAEFSRSRLGRYLSKLYNEQSDLVVVVICRDYVGKEWCGLEWDAIFDLLKQRRESEVMLSRFNYAIIDGLFSDAGFSELDDKTPEQFAALILERLALNEGKAIDYYTKERRGLATTPLSSDVLLGREKAEKEGGELREDQVIVAEVQPLELGNGYEAAKQVRTNLDNNIRYVYFFQGNTDAADKIPRLLQLVLIAGFLDKNDAASFTADGDLVTNHRNEILEALKDICSIQTLNIFFLNHQPELQYRIHNATSYYVARLYLKHHDEFIEWESGQPAYRFWCAMREKNGANDPQPPDAVFHGTRDFELKDGPFLRELKMNMRKWFRDIADEVMELCLKGVKARKC